MSDERWLPVVGFEGRYEVSDLGRVRSLDHICYQRIGRGKTPDRRVAKAVWGRVLKPGRGSHGYLTINIERKSHCIHVLVLNAFVGPCPDGMEACHNNGIKLDICLTNLRWDTPKANTHDSIIHGAMVLGEQRRQAKLTGTSAKHIRALKGIISQSSLARHFGVSPAAVQAVHDGRTWKHV